jgi:hypothetical protein
MCHIPNVVLYIYLIISECGICFAVTILFFFVWTVRSTFCVYLSSRKVRT